MPTPRVRPARACATALYQDSPACVPAEPGCRLRWHERAPVQQHFELALMAQAQKNLATGCGRRSTSRSVCASSRKALSMWWRCSRIREAAVWTSPASIASTSLVCSSSGQADGVAPRRPGWPGTSGGQLVHHVVQDAAAAQLCQRPCIRSGVRRRMVSGCDAQPVHRVRPRP